MFKAREIKKDIYWVGALEWEERYIHGFTSPFGSTNNAYLIMDEKITLIDTCIGTHSRELIERISDVVDPAKIDYIISNHSEKDHAASIGCVLELAKNAKVVTSDPKGYAILQTYFGPDVEYVPVKSGDKLNIGKRTLEFIHTPMVHWPDNMVTYSREDSILFSNDAFGQFIATSKRFDDEVNLDFVLQSAKKYFANIVAPFIKQTAKALEAVKTLDLEMICPSHGIIWRSHIGKILGLYERLCECQSCNSAVVVYSSIYGSTKRMAEVITEAFMEANIEVRLYDLDISDISDIMTDVYFAKYLAVGSPTHNNTVLPPMGEFLTYFKGLHPRAGERIGISFGSYGWAPAAQKEIAETLQAAKYEMPLEPISEDWNDNSEDEEILYEKILGYLQGE